jgi:hypothetical protein
MKNSKRKLLGVLLFNSNFTPRTQNRFFYPAVFLPLFFDRGVPEVKKGGKKQGVENKAVL